MNNADLNCRRDLEACKTKFRQVKQQAKKNVIKHRAALARTGNLTPPPPLDPLYARIAAVMPAEALSGIEDGIDTRQVNQLYFKGAGQHLRSTILID